MKDLNGFSIRSSYFNSRKKILCIDTIEAKASANVGEIVSDVDATEKGRIHELTLSFGGGILVTNT